MAERHDEDGAGRSTQEESKLGFLDSLAGLFRGKPDAAPPATAEPAQGFEALRIEFEAAVRDLQEKAESLKSERESVATGPTVRVKTAEQRAAEEARRTAEAHQAIRKDIGSAHARLRTGLEDADLEALAEYLTDLATLSEAGRGSHELLPRARFAIGEKLRSEAGELAATRLVELLQREQQSWPDPIRYRPTASPEEIERSRRRRLAETRENFLAQSLARTAERLLGIVKTWGADYPDPGSPLWEETVLEGVAAGIRGQLVKESVEVLQRDRDAILASTEAAIGRELAALQQTLRSGVASLEQANHAVASSLRALDEVLPGIVWEHIRSQLPAARGEWSA